MTTQVGVGFSQFVDPVEAGRQAAEQAVEPLAGRDPDLVVLFSTAGLDPRQVLAGVRSATGKAKLIGGCSEGIIVPQGAYRSGVAVLALQSEKMCIAAGVASGASQDPAGASQGLVRRLTAQRDKACQNANALLLTLAGHQESEVVVREVQAMGDEVGPHCQLVGGGTVSSSGQIERPLFADGDTYGDAVVAALFLTCGPVGVGIKHGYRPSSRPLVVTRSSGNILYELDGRSAFQAYVEQFPDRPELTLASFGQFALDYPLGLPQMGREYIIRDPLGARPDGSLVCAGTIPEHVVVRIMSGNRETLLQAAKEAAIEAMQPLAGGRPLLAFVFSCVSRLAYLGQSAQEEVATMRDVIGPETPLIGLFSFGEVAAQPDSPPALHNKTVVAGVVGDPEM